MKLAAVILTLPLLLVGHGSADAAVVWDEAVDGDLSNFNQSPTAIRLGVGDNTVKGTIGGSPNPAIGDGFDLFTFRIGPKLSWTGIIVDNYVLNGSNTTSFFDIYRGPDAVGGFLGQTSIDPGDIGLNIMTLPGMGGPYGPGHYTVQFREITVPGQVYDFRYQVTPTVVPYPSDSARDTQLRLVPEPTQITLAPVICWLAGFARRRHRQPA